MIPLRLAAQKANLTGAYRPALGLAALVALTLGSCQQGSLRRAGADGQPVPADGAGSEAAAGDGRPRADGAQTDGPRRDVAGQDAVRADAARVDGQAPPGSLSARYPGDEGLADDPAVLFFDDFEQGWGRWDWPSQDTAHLHLEQNAALAHGGGRLLRSTVTWADLEADQYISSSTGFTFPRRVETVYWRFYARFKGIAPNPHHWVRMSAGDANYASSGLANTVPPGDQGFWFDFDTNNDDVFNFYVYWYLMRSGRCNDGTAVPGCDGDQGTTYYYGNVFQPPGQSPFVRDQWFCVEIKAKANTLGSADGELAFWVNGQLVDEYKPGHPSGSWLRATFYTDGCSYSACAPPAPFEGFNFRSSDEVRFKQIFLDAYYQRDTFLSKKAALEARGLTVSDEQTIYYDDVVAATERIGCKVSP